MTDAQLSASARRHRRRARVARLASTQEGIIARADVYAAGITRGEVRANIRAGRWRRGGTHVIVTFTFTFTFTGPLTRRAKHWVAVIEGGPRAALDAESALEAGGLTGYAAARIRISVPRGARVRTGRLPGWTS